MKKFIFDKLITHGWQFPVRAFVIYEQFLSNYSHMSQAGQDKIILELLDNKQEGYFVELGASNGVTSSNTYVLEKKYRWRGLCIEPNQRFFKQLAKNRNCTIINTLVSGKEEEVFFNNDGATGHIDKEGEKMQTTSLANILRANNSPKIIDYLSLDVEGYEEVVLYDFPFDEYEFRVMSIERPPKKLHDKLLSVGYELYVEIKPNGNWLDNIYIKSYSAKLI